MKKRRQFSTKFKAQVVVAIDAKKTSPEKWEVVIGGGKMPTGIDAILWSKKAESFGAGEILLTSIDRDGTKIGFDISLTNAVSTVVTIPVIASGGAKTPAHFAEVFEKTNATGALAASIFHFGEVEILDLKKYLHARGIAIRLLIFPEKMNLDFKKMGGLVPVIIQDFATKSVLMLGFANAEALEKTKETGEVYFFSRTKNRIWKKGETSGNILKVRGIFVDCDCDTILIMAEPTGHVCHTGTESCFGEIPKSDLEFLCDLEKMIASR